jgi:tyrosine-specific transport protein
MDPKQLVPGSVLGGALLIAGCCIGAGMLALPVLTGLAGFFPSLLALGAVWAFMTFTGLLFVEINGWFYGQVNLLSMAKEAFGEPGRVVGWLTYLLLFYSLLMAYLSASGAIFSAVLFELFDISIHPSIASIFFAFFFGFIIYLGTRPVDLCNRLLMAGLIIAYLGMIGLGIFRIHPSHLFHADMRYVLISLPVLVTSFGFQNMIPSVTAYMKGDLQRVRQTILYGSLLTLAVYVIWSIFVLGIVPVKGPNGLFETYQRGEEASMALSAALGSSRVTFFAQAFAFFAIVTSFLTIALGLTHFLADGLRKIPNRGNHWIFTLLTVLPPLFFSLTYPTLFYKALGFAGGICAMIIFGILPITMAWIGRYKKNITSSYHVAGGKPALSIGMGFCLLVIICELVRIFR